MGRNKKLLISTFLVMVMLCSCIFTSVPDAKAFSDGYVANWGVMYRDPDVQNRYGRCWYGTKSNFASCYMCVDSYYSYGSYASVKYNYYNSNKKKKSVLKKDSSYYGDSDVAYTKDVKGTYINTTFYGSAHGIVVSCTKK